MIYWNIDGNGPREVFKPEVEYFPQLIYAVPNIYYHWEYSVLEPFVESIQSNLHKMRMLV